MVISKASLSKERAIQIMRAGFWPDTKICLSISGHSMCPLIQPGARVILSNQITPAQILVGDIVAIINQRHSAIMVHRVIFIRRKNPILFFTKGDGNRDFDKAIPPDHILGKIIAVQQRDLSRPCWRIAGFLIAVGSGISAILHRWINYYLSYGKIKLKIAFWSHKLLFFIYRLFLHMVILPLP